ncbi:MAG: hypothetical protein UV74_C0013G0274 [Candidatus Woesebacteria bacterium GW2011_GWB1_43_14]|uniref:AAA+ ATPase domain-containing protein n=1 Tax=Candidatus Woesebacteria bacterium GW2011_GWB1_43_14 TaxID=1618578 RepID=A0A0G1DHW8_9BACT|nr:MAG: hypothetical protein UT21_C0002G0018 [Candidatus Woesebacteria bacterium GW2011_GWA1_39_11b]KKS78431.1 MAG: hypothetical protein UV51_C0001G0147 [Candidatus Woesebacteria bacterium GW2011_GWC1_42_9]KKS97152.1 MAG: hypothetical protein UV74_C0013G0274 [Candidatus Woesebacteria bacterium GW2011_GWB1_43_14]
MVLLENESRYNHESERLDGELSLVFIRGLPGSGKTTVASEMVRLIGINGVELIDPDIIDKDSEDYSEFVRKLSQAQPELDPKFFLYRYMLFRARCALLEGRSVIWDQPFSLLSGLKHAIVTTESYFQNLSEIQVIIVDLDIDPEESYKRVQDRISKGGHGPDRLTFDSFVSKYQPAECLGRNHISLSGMGSPIENAERVFEMIKCQKKD